MAYAAISPIYAIPDSFPLTTIYTDAILRVMLIGVSEVVTGPSPI